MNILQINKFHYLRGGSERHVFELSKLLEDRGHKVIHFSMKDEKNVSSLYSKYFISPVDLHKFSIKNIIKYFYNYEAIKNLKKLLSENKVDVAHVHNNDGQIGSAIFRILKKKNIRVVQTLHDYKLICPNAKFFSRSKICESCKNGKYYHCFLKKCVHDSFAKSFLAATESYINKTIFKNQTYVDKYIAPSRFMKEKCVDFGIEEKKLVEINNFLNLEQLYFIENQEENYLLYFGRLSEEKGISTLIEAMTRIKSGTKLKIAGTGPEEEKLKLRVKNLGLMEKIDFVGFKNENDLKGLIEKAKAIVMPSTWYENMPYSLIESLAASKVAIVSKTGGMQELIEDRVNGILFERGNAIDLAEKVKLLDEIDVSKIKANARISAKKFDGKIFYEKLMNVYMRAQ